MKVEENINIPVAPDGGWAWIVMLAYALSNICTIPVIQGFGLIFKDIFPVIGVNNTQGSTIVNLNLAFGMILGLFNGPLLRKYGYRKIAILGSVINSIGIILTTFADNFVFLLISYGLLASLGTTLISSAFSLALNTYFARKRSKATGFAITLFGIGSILMPPVTTFLMDYYGPQGTILLYGAYSCHTFIASLLLHPVKWHAKKTMTIPDDEETAGQTKMKKDVEIVENGKLITAETLKNGTEEDEHSIREEATMENCQIPRIKGISLSDIDHDVEVASIYGFETPLLRQFSETARTVSYDRSLDGWTPISYSELSTSNLHVNRPKPSYHWWSSGKSMDTVNLGSSMKIFDENAAYQSLRKNVSFHDSVKGPPAADNSSTMSETSTDSTSKKSRTMRILLRVVAFYDLSLLKDPIYVNIMMGMSIAIFAEMNFSLLTPFILEDRGLSSSEIANTMSIIATVDLIFRAISPYLGDWLHQPPRIMYLISLVFLLLSRSALLFFYSFTPITIVAVGLGVAKGVRSVYMSLVIPSYVPIQRLAYASAIQMVVNGFILLAAGPFLGVITDISGNYTLCVILINFMTGVTIVIWLIELIIVRRRKRRQLQQHPEEQLEKN